MKIFKSLVFKTFIGGTVITLIAFAASIMAMAAGAAAETPAPVAYEATKLEATGTGTADVQTIKTTTSSQLGVYLSISKASLPAYLKENKMAYYVFKRDKAPIAVTSDDLTVMIDKIKNNANILMSADFPSYGFGTGEGSFYFEILIFSDTKEPLGCITNSSPIVVSPGKQSQSVEFSVYQIKKSEQAAAVSVNPSAPAVSSPSAAVSPAAAPPPATQPSPVPPVSPAPTADSGKASPAITPGQTTAAAAGAVVVLFLGGGAGFIALNAADFKEVIQLSRLAAVSGGAAASGATAANKMKYPFVYLKLRKYSFVLGLADEEGVGTLLKKVRLPFKSGVKAVMDLSGVMSGDTYKILKIRHPKKSMNGKKDVTIAYRNNEAIIEQDHFDSKDSYVNIKYIEK